MRVWSGKRLAVDTEDVDGHTYEIVRTPQAASVVLLDEEGRTLLVEQDRPAVGARLTELVAGLVDPGETPRQAAERELAEEAGLAAEGFEQLLVLHTSPGMSEEVSTVFLAHSPRSLPQGPQREPAEQGMTLRWVPLAEAVGDCLAGRITDGPAVAGLLAAERRGR